MARGPEVRREPAVKKNPGDGRNNKMGGNRMERLLVSHGEMKALVI
jgi:hypothetical protein